MVSFSGIWSFGGAFAYEPRLDDSAARLRDFEAVQLQTISNNALGPRLTSGQKTAYVIYASLYLKYSNDTIARTTQSQESHPIAPTCSKSMEASPHDSATGSAGDNGLKRKRTKEPSTHTRILAACDACRSSKTRCDSARPTCVKCRERGLACTYPERDPFSM